MPELALNHDERDSFVGHFDRVCMSQLMRRESPPHTCRGGGACELLAGRCCLPMTARSRTVNYAQQRTDQQPCTHLKPWIQLLPGPAVHSDLAALAALAASDQDAAVLAVEIRLGKIERLTDA